MVKRSKAPLFALLGLLVVGGAVAAFVMMGGKKEETGTGTGTDAGTIAKVTVDAAGVTPPPVTIDAAPEVETREGMVRFEGGTFEMGGPAKYKKLPGYEAPHAVTVAPFFLDKTEAAGEDGMPLTKISWTAAKEHCEKAGKRLPTAAEWELAARSGTLADANLKKKAGGAPAKVATHAGDCTAEGVCDLLGNVMEWTADDDKGNKVVRGASYMVAPGGWYASIHARVPLDPGTADAEVGFRCAADAKGTP